MKIDNEKPEVVIGKIGSPYGIKGWLKIQSYATNKHDIFDYMPWYDMTTDSKPQLIPVESTQIHGNALLVKMSAIASPEKARQFTGKLIHIYRSQLPTLAQNEYYWSDLKNLMVVNKQGTSLGYVYRLLETGSNDVLIVKSLQKQTEQAVPYLPSVVLDIDLNKKIILVDWDEPV